MAATTYYMVCSTDTDMIYMTAKVQAEAEKASAFQKNTEVRSASFSTNSGDAPDVLAAWPSVGGTFVEPGTYSGPEKTSKLKLTWGGDGAAVDGIHEIDADGLLSADLTIEKVDEDNAAMNAASDNDEFRVMVVGGAAKPSIGRGQLTNGAATVSFTPAEVEKGLTEVKIMPVNQSGPKGASTMLQVICLLICLTMSGCFTSTNPAWRKYVEQEGKNLKLMRPTFAKGLAALEEKGRDSDLTKNDLDLIDTMIEENEKILKKMAEED